MNSEWVRKCHWAIAMAGGYATYGDWSNGVSYFYMGIPSRGKVAPQLKHLRLFFESLLFRELIPSDNLTSNGYCLAKKHGLYIFCLPKGGSSEIDLTGLSKRRFDVR